VRSTRVQPPQPQQHQFQQLQQLRKKQKKKRAEKRRVSFLTAFTIIFLISVAIIIVFVSGVPNADKIILGLAFSLIIISFVSVVFGRPPTVPVVEGGIFFGTLEQEEFLGREVNKFTIEVANRTLHVIDVEKYDERKGETIRKRIVFLYGSPDRTDILVPIKQDGRVIRQVLRGFKLSPGEAAEKLLVGKDDPWLLILEPTEPEEKDINKVRKELEEKTRGDGISEVIYYAPYAPNDLVKDFLRRGLETLSNINFKVVHERERTVKVLEKIYDEFRSRLSKILETVIPLAWKISDTYADGLDLAGLVLLKGASGLEALKLEQIAEMKDIETQLEAYDRITKNIEKWFEKAKRIRRTEEEEERSKIEEEIYEIKRTLAALMAKVEQRSPRPEVVPEKVEVGGQT